MSGVLMSMVIGGKIHGKARPRMGRGGRFYTPKETVEYEREIAKRLVPMTFKNRNPKLRLDIMAYYANERHPDMDNVYKLVADAIAHAWGITDKHFYGSLRFKHLSKAESERLLVLIGKEECV